MNFTQVKRFLSNHIHTILFLLGLVFITIAITFLTNPYYGLLALGVCCLLVSGLLNTG